MPWSERDIAGQSGRTVLVTGANSGLGLRTATVLAAKGARVLLGCRSVERGAKALDEVASAATGPAPELVSVDLADLDSVSDAVAKVRASSGDELHVLVNNAGVMAVPRGRTADGHETQFGTNHLGHAALTWQLLPALYNAGTADRPARVVTVSSIAAARGRIDATDLNFERRPYNPAAAYAQAKLANQVFAMELDARLRAAERDVISLAAHPGLTATNLASAMAGAYRNPAVATVLKAGTWVSDRLLAQGVEPGALPQLYAATEPGVAGGEYFGPSGFQQMKGPPKRIRPLRPARDATTRRQLWELTRELTGITPDLPGDNQ